MPLFDILYLGLFFPFTWSLDGTCLTFKISGKLIELIKNLTVINTGQEYSVVVGMNYQY